MKRVIFIFSFFILPSSFNAWLWLDSWKEVLAIVISYKNYGDDEIKFDLHLSITAVTNENTGGFTELGNVVTLVEMICVWFQIVSTKNY